MRRGSRECLPRYDPPDRRPRESGDPVAFVKKTLDSRFRGNDE